MRTAIKLKMAAVVGGRGVELWLMLLFLFGDFAGADNLDELIYKLVRNVEESQVTKVQIVIQISHEVHLCSTYTVD